MPDPEATPARVPHDYVMLRLDAAANDQVDARAVPRIYGTFPEPEGTDPAPEFAGDVNPRIFLPKGGRPYAARGLRVALAMKGGVSLAVWIGGAVAELDVLRRIRVFQIGDGPAQALLIRPAPTAVRAPGAAPVAAPDEELLLRADAYARVLHRHGYDRVEFDVLAGASAGGLNAVMYSVAQRAGVGLDGILGTWLTTGSAWGLLQTGDPAQFDSVLRGDTYFWPELAGALGRIAAGDVGGATSSATAPGDPTDRRGTGDADAASDLDGIGAAAPMRAETDAARAALASPHVVVDLSATLIDATDTTERGTAEGRAHFRFVGDDTDPVPDRGIPGRSADADTDAPIAWSRLAYAARSTSSFPGAFEPALIYSGTEPLRPSGELNTPDMRNVFSAHRAEIAKHPFRVVDGGVLDNIPIDRALRAVRNVPANEHVNRALIYLDPSPKERTKALVRATEYDGEGPMRPPPEPKVRDDRLSRFLYAVPTALRKRTSESGEDEIDQVYADRTAAIVRKGRDELLAVRLDPTPTADEEPADRSLAAYTRMRSTTDADLLGTVFARPGEWTLGTNLESRPQRRALDRLSIQRVGAALRRVLDQLSRSGEVAPMPGEPDLPPIADDAISLGSQTLVDTAFCVLDWIRALEDQTFHTSGLHADGRNTTGLHAFDDALRAADDDAYGNRGRTRAAVRETLYDVLRDARDLRDGSIAAALDRVDAIAPADSPLSAAGAESVARTWIAANGDDSATRTTLWQGLDGIVRWLQRANAVLAAQPGQEEWAESPWHRMPTQGTPLPASELPLIFGGSGMPTASSPVRFHVIGSDTQPAAVSEYRTLLDAQVLDGYKAALAKPVEDLADADLLRRLIDDRVLYSSSKLAGLRIANFAGFLSTDWRRNDWWWGRLDASAGIVSFLESMDVAPNISAVAGSELGGVQAALLREMNASAERPYAKAVTSDPTTIRAEVVRGTQDLESLRSGYRIALATRVVRSLSAATVRGSRKLSPVRVGQWLMRPLLVLAPLLLSTPRLILALVVFACGLMLSVRQLTGQLDESAAVSRSLFGASAALVVAAIIVLVRLVTAARAAGARRRRIDAHLGDDTANRLADATRAQQVVSTAEGRARLPRIALVVVTIALLAAFFVVSLRFGLWTLPFWIALVTLIGVTELTHRQLQTVAVARRRRPLRWVVLVGFTVVALIVTSLLPQWLDGIAEQARSPLAFVSDGVWGSLAWRLIAAAVVVAGITVTLFATTMRVRHLFVVLLAAEVTMVIAVTATTLLAAIDDTAGGDDPLAIAIAAGITAAQGWAAYLITAWAVGTVLWWAPWFRGFDMAATPPTDAVWDLVPGSLVDAERTRR
ncbi:DUF3376 domain-containing protein [Agromyces allii]|uniref:PNPLA domain-containing protein n=1 Tax=Agromyces allii TaxID=393607 RepID=A0ABP5BHQ1_9MICO|nr:DUF3376 domain-containing protein [Agromyces allii]